MLEEDGLFDGNGKFSYIDGQKMGIIVVPKKVAINSRN